MRKFMVVPIWGILLALTVVHIDAGGIPGLRNMNRLLKGIRKTFSSGGGRRGPPATTTTTTLPTTTATGFNFASLNLGSLGMDGGSGGSVLGSGGGKGLPFDPAAILAQLGLRGAPPGGATGNAVAPSGEGRVKGGSLETSGSQNVKTAAVASNPTDLLGQLSISFDRSQAKNGAGGPTGDVTSQFLGMLPMLLSVAKPVMAGYKGTGQHGDFMTMLQDAKQLFSNREVIRQINQFLDELITGDDTQTPPTPSDSSLTSLAQLAQQNMESLFNVPQARPKNSPSYSRKTAGLGKTVPEDSNDAVNEIPESSDSAQTDREDSALQSDGS